MFQKNQNHKGSYTERAARFFEIAKVGDKTHKCNLCGKLINGTKPSNLASHLKCVHTEMYEKLILCEKNPNYYEMKRVQFLQICTEIVAINKRSFSYLCDTGFRKAMENRLLELKEGNVGINLDKASFHPELKNYMRELSLKVRENIKQEIKNKFVALMMDIATKNHRSYLGVSVQYVLNGTVQIKSIGIQEICGSHTADYIKEVTLSCLTEFNISKNQVISITTDNGSNMIAMVKRFDVDENECTIDSDDDNCSGDDFCAEFENAELSEDALPTDDQENVNNHDVESVSNITYRFDWYCMFYMAKNAVNLNKIDRFHFSGH